MKTVSISIVLLFSGIFFAPAQELVQKTADCSGFHENNCPSLKEPFKRNGQSKSALFAVGDTSELNFVAYKGHDYRVDICRAEMFSNKVRFRVIDTEMKKETTVKMDTSGFNNSKDTVTSYEKKRVVLYDNKDNDDSQTLEFSNPDKTRHLKLQVIATGESSKSNKLKTREMGCIGVSIGHAPTRDTGFR